MRSTRRSGRSRSNLPSAWTEWEWNAVWKCQSRYRKIAENNNDDDYEYQYRAPPSPSTPRDQRDNTASVASLATIEETSNSLDASTPNDYSLNLQTTTAALAHTSLNEGRETLQRTQSGQGRPQSGTGRGSAYHSSLNSVQPGFNDARRIYTRNPEVQTDIDPEFTLHKSWEFSWGRVFKVLWSEPTGSGGTELTGVRKALYGESAYHSIRRFVIISPREGHCICLPILTYGGRGTLKPGIHASHHAVIFTGKAPVMKSGERITKKSIRMVPIDPRHKLDPASRINYAKLYTVEHNVKVHFIGEIAQKYGQIVVTDYNDTHQPLLNRPYFAGTSDENTYGHAQGGDSNYTFQPQPTPWSTATTSVATPAYAQPQSFYSSPAASSYTTSYVPHSGSGYQSGTDGYTAQTSQHTLNQGSDSFSYPSEHGYTGTDSSTAPGGYSANQYEGHDQGGPANDDQDHGPAAPQPDEDDLYDA